MRFSAPDREEILTGPALWVMARIGGPAVVSSLLFTLYNLADAFWIGRLPPGESAAVMAGIQVSWPIVWFLISLVAGFGGAAVTALVAQYMGAGREEEANYSLNQLFGLVLVAGVGIGLLGYALSPWLLDLLVGEGAVATAAVVYLRVIFLGLLTMIIPGLFHFALAATGDTLTPLLVNGAGTLINMLLDPFLVLGWGRSLLWASWGRPTPPCSPKEWLPPSSWSSWPGEGGRFACSFRLCAPTGPGRRKPLGSAFPPRWASPVPPSGSWS